MNQPYLGNNGRLKDPRVEPKKVPGDSPHLDRITGMW